MTLTRIFIFLQKNVEEQKPYHSQESFQICNRKTVQSHELIMRRIFTVCIGFPIYDMPSMSLSACL